MAAVRFDSMRTVAHGAITNAYLALGAALTQNWRMFKITNNTDGDMLFSFDGTTNNLFVPADSFVLYDCGTNAPNISNLDSFVMQIGTQFYIKYSTAPTSGDVWIEGLYARN